MRTVNVRRALTSAGIVLLGLFGMLVVLLSALVLDL